MTSEDILKIINLKHAWEFILNKNVILSDTNFSLLCEINKMIEEGFYYSAGKVRTDPITIDGTKWKPELPIESIINHYLISKGKGIIVIPADLTEKFKDLLILYYEGKDENTIKKFIKEMGYISL